MIVLNVILIPYVAGDNTPYSCPYVGRDRDTLVVELLERECES